MEMPVQQQEETPQPQPKTPQELLQHRQTVKVQVQETPQPQPKTPETALRHTPKARPSRPIASAAKLEQRHGFMPVKVEQLPPEQQPAPAVGREEPSALAASSSSSSSTADTQQQQQKPLPERKKPLQPRQAATQLRVKAELKDEAPASEPSASSSLRKAMETQARPCPAPWKRCQTEDGELFYFNLETGDTLWEHPSDVYPKNRHQEQDRVAQVTGVSSSALAKKLKHLLAGVPMTPPQVKVEPPAAAATATEEELRYPDCQVKYEPHAEHEEGVPSSHFQADAASQQGQFMAKPVEPATEVVQARGSVARECGFIVAPVETSVTPTKNLWQALTASRQARGGMARPVEPPAKENTIAAQACKRALPRPPWKDATSLPPPPSGARLPQSPTRPPKRALPQPSEQAAGKQVRR